MARSGMLELSISRLRRAVFSRLIPVVLLSAFAWTPWVTSAQSVSAGANLWKNYDAQDNPTGKGCEGCHGATHSVRAPMRR